MNYDEDDDADRGNPIWINHDALHNAYNELEMDPREIGLQFTLVMLCCAAGLSMPSDPQALADRINAWSRNGETITADEMERMRPKLLRFFTATSDGNWTPSPEFYALNDPYVEEGEQ